MDSKETTMVRRLMFLMCAASVLGHGGSAFAQDGAALFKAHCAACHDAPEGRVTPTSALRSMTQPAILGTLDTGVMRAQAAGLTAEERAAIASYLAAPRAETAETAQTCAGGNAAAEAAGSAWSNWGNDVSNSRFQGAQAAGIAAAQVPELKLKWAFSLGQITAARGQPAVAMGRVFVASYLPGATAKVYALDAMTGCTQWEFHADNPVRTGVAAGTAGAAKQAAIFFGDQRTNIYAVDAVSGQILWKAHAENHPAAVVTAAPLFHDGVVYVGVSSGEEVLAAAAAYECCTFRGSVSAYDAATGKQLWKTFTIAAAPQPTGTARNGATRRGPSGAGVWSTPTFDEKLQRIYVATGDNYSDPPSETSDAVLALDAKTGNLLWSQQATAGDAYTLGCSTAGKTGCPDANGPDFDFGQPPVLVSLANGSRVLVAGQKSGIVHAFDPDHDGKPMWNRRIGQGGKLGGIMWGSAAEGERIYVALSDLQLKILRDPGVPQGYRLDVDPDRGGGLFALNAATGEVVWKTSAANCAGQAHCSPAQSAPVSAIPGAVFSGSLDGHLRAYASETGAVIWDADTAIDFNAVNGAAHGGSLDVAGPVIAGGMVYTVSGYNQWGGKPGNVLLAYSVGGR
jgi:polyvinyl alcohol dehydrogenase (cytochrome)